MEAGNILRHQSPLLTQVLLFLAQASGHCSHRSSLGEEHQPTLPRPISLRRSQELQRHQAIPGNKGTRAKESKKQRQKGGGSAEERHPHHSSRAARKGWRAHGCSQQWQDQGTTGAPRIRPLWSRGQQHSHREESKAVPRAGRATFQRNHPMVLEELLVQLSPGPGERVTMLSTSDEEHLCHQCPRAGQPSHPPLQEQAALVPPAQCQALVTSRSVRTLPTAV